MSQLSDYAENGIINLFLNNTSFTAVATPYVSLHTANPADDASGTEVSGGSYARVNSASSWPTASGTGGSINNNADINFAEATASWGTVTHFGVWDAASSGNMLFYGSLTSSKTIGSGDTAKFPSGDLTFTVA